MVPYRPVLAPPARDPFDLWLKQGLRERWGGLLKATPLLSRITQSGAMAVRKARRTTLISAGFSQRGMWA